jgi:hypothetical protein
MQSVPETRPLKAFQSSPTVSLRSLEISEQPNVDGEGSPQGLKIRPMPLLQPQRPFDSRTSTVWSRDLSPVASSLSPRSTSPYAQSQSRSRSGVKNADPAALRAGSLPPMAPAQLNEFLPPRYPSPRRSSQTNEPTRKAFDEGVRPGFHRSNSIGSDGSSRMSDDEGSLSQAPGPGSSPRTIFTSSYLRPHRPVSPMRLQSSHSNVSGNSTPTTPSYSLHSPSYNGSKYNEAFPNSYNASYPSSVPTTPTSIRSRSPSISSLEPIEDSPAAEEAAAEAHEQAQLKAHTDNVHGDAATSELQRKMSLDAMYGRGRTLGLTYGSRDKRKRWSVCGAERRGELDLDTIWED